MPPLAARQSTTPTAAGPTLATIAKALAWRSGGHALTQVSWLGSIVILAALLPPRAFGTVAAAMTIVAVTTLLMESGTSGSIIAARDLTFERLKSAAITSFLLGLTLTVLTVALAEPVTANFARGSDPAVLRALMLTIVLAALGIVPLAVLVKALEFKRRTLITLAAATASAFLALLTAVLGGGVWALVVRQISFQALLTALAWIAVRDMLPARAQRPEVRSQRYGIPTFSWFFLLALSDFFALSFDNLLVGGLTDATELGLYSLAFSLAFTPLTQISWQVGGVLFPAAALTENLDVVARRTLKTARLVALLLLPFVPPALVMAPVLLPAVFGGEWTPMVPTFQILLVVGVAHGILNLIGESLSGTGNIKFRAKVHLLWAAMTTLAVVALTSTLGIRGAALAHLLVFLLLAGAYLSRGTRLIGLSAREFVGGLAPVVGLATAQGLFTAIVAGSLIKAGVEQALAHTAAAVMGLGLFVILLLRLRPQVFGEARAVLRAALAKAGR